MALRALGVLAAAAVLFATAAEADAAMRSKQLAPRLCETTGGGKFVRIPGFPGERVDRRLLNDIRWMRKRFHIFITDAHSTSSIHAANGEHPIGLALDIVPDKSEGGRWRHITKLANWAEPRQDRPRLPFRWVGYNGDAGHGRGHHLHLSYSHGRSRFNRPVRKMMSVKCPGKRRTAPDGDGKTGGDSGGDTGGVPGGSGGAEADRVRTGPSGGISPRLATFRLAPIVTETGGVSAP